MFVGVVRATLLAVLLAGVAAPLAHAGEQLDITIPARNAQIADRWLPGYANPPRARVLLPDGYDRKRAYPLLVLLHGANGNYKVWSAAGQGQVAKTAKGFPGIIVMPEGGTGMYVDWYNGGKRGGPSWETYILEDVVPEVVKRFRIRPQRRWHALAGVSMGGLGTAYLGGRLPGFFGSIAVISGTVDTHIAPLAVGVVQSWVPQLIAGELGDPQAAVGPDRGFYSLGHDPVRLVANLAHTRVYMATGNGIPTSDGEPNPTNVVADLAVEGLVVKPMSDSYAKALAATGADLTYEPHDGIHDWANFRPELRDAIAWGLFRPVVERPTSLGQRHRRHKRDTLGRALPLRHTARPHRPLPPQRPPAVGQRSGRRADADNRSRLRPAAVDAEHGHDPAERLSMRRSLVLGGLLAALVAPSPAQGAKHCDEPRGKWQRATPAEAGMDAAKVAEAVRFASANNSIAVRVLRYGCLVAEDSFNPERVGIPFQSFSLAKSVTSMVFGRAWTLGLIGPDDPIGSLFPEADAEHGALLVRHMATMTTGNSQQFLHDFNLAMADRVRDALTIPLVAKPGETFNYWQTGPAMLAASVARAAGEDFQAFAQRELFGPIGIRRDSWLWTGDLKGNTAGFWGLWMRADDYARIGELLRREGMWRGRRLLSKHYVHDALQPIKPFGCYAWLIWRQATRRCNWPVHLGLPEDMWQFNGAQGQIVTTFPSQGLMVVRTGVDPSQSNWAVGGDANGAAERGFHDRVLGAITDTPVKIERKPRDPSLPSHLAQQRGSAGDELQGGLASVVQPALPPAGPWRARAVLIDELTPRADRKGRFAVRLRCPPVWPGHDGGCRGQLTAKHGRSPVTYDVAPGEAGVVRPRLTSRALRRVRRHGKLSIALQAVTHDGTAAGTVTPGAVDVRRP